LDAGQVPLVGAVANHLIDVFRVPIPEFHGDAIPGQQHRESGSPGTGAKDRYGGWPLFLHLSTN
jgi:hypothetical protein